MAEDKRVRITVDLTANQKRRLELLAVALGKSQNELVRELIEGKLDEYPELADLADQLKKVAEPG